MIRLMPVHGPALTAVTLCAAIGLSGTALASSASSEELGDAARVSATPLNGCDAVGNCTYRVTPAQLLQQAEKLVHEKNYDDAMPLVAALGQVPELQLQQKFLAGFIAVETGRYDDAISNFRNILNDDPGQTRVRLELARTYLMQGKEGAADYHFRLAQNDEDLPEEISRTIRNTRSILRNQRVWHFSFDFGFAPDTNINGATSAEAIDINFGVINPLFGDQRGELELDDNAREKSGIGQTAGFSGGVRLKTGGNLAVLFDVNSKLTNYKGEAADDAVVQLAVGPELRIGKYSSVSAQAVGQQRWFGGRLVTREYGGRVGYQQALNAGQRIGVEFDARRTESKISDAYSGWQLGANATLEQIVGKSFIASASLFTRRDILNSKGFSSQNYGVNIGVGGELPMGINAGVSGGVSRSIFDEPIILYSDDARKDWRGFARAYVGSRKYRLFGFSPSIDYNYTRVDSNYGLYEMDRHRVNFKLARYF